MKKGSIIFLFIIIIIVATVVTSSLWEGFGFALTCVIFIFALMCIATVVCGIIAVFAEIRQKHLLEAVKFLAIVIICAFVGIKLLKWLMEVLA